MATIREIAEKAGLTEDEIEPYGRYKAKVDLSVMKREKENGKLIGTCGFFAFNEDALKAELGYELNSSYQGKGIMTEAITEALAFLFKKTEVNRAEAYVEPENTASQKLLEKLGFTKEGTLRQYERCRGELIDICVFGLLRSDRE